MLATAGELPTGPGWSFEFKWDGVRALAVATPTAVHWYARSGAEITTAYPELSGLHAARQLYAQLRSDSDEATRSGRRRLSR